MTEGGRRVVAFRASGGVRLEAGAWGSDENPPVVEELCRLIPHAKVEDIAEAHHMVAGDENDAFSSAVLEFLQPPRLGLSALKRPPPSP